MEEFNYYKRELKEGVTHILSTYGDKITSFGISGKNDEFPFGEDELIKIDEIEFEKLLKLTNFFKPTELPLPHSIFFINS